MVYYMFRDSKYIGFILRGQISFFRTVLDLCAILSKRCEECQTRLSDVCQRLHVRSQPEEKYRLFLAHVRR